MIAGATLTAGEPVYLNGSNQALACVNSAQASTACIGITLNGASAGQPVTIALFGQGFSLTIGATVLVGTPYYVSSNAGKIMPVADLTTSEYLFLIGTGLSSTTLSLDGINYGAVTHA